MLKSKPNCIFEIGDYLIEIPNLDRKFKDRLYFFANKRITSFDNVDVTYNNDLGEVVNFAVQSVEEFDVENEIILALIDSHTKQTVSNSTTLQEVKNNIRKNLHL